MEIEVTNEVDQSLYQRPEITIKLTLTTAKDMIIWHNLTHYEDSCPTGSEWWDLMESFETEDPNDVIGFCTSDFNLLEDENSIIATIRIVQNYTSEKKGTINEKLVEFKDKIITKIIEAYHKSDTVHIPGARLSVRIGSHATN